MNIHPRRAFTVPELLIGVLLSVLVLLVTHRVFLFGTSLSRHRATQSEVYLEGSLVLQEVARDLANSCWTWDDQKTPVYTINQIFTISGGHFPNTRYSFLMFPRTGNISQVVPTEEADPETRKRWRLAHRIDFFFAPSPLADGQRFPKDFPVYSLVREEVFHPRHPEFKSISGGRRRKILSERVVQFEISPYTVADSQEHQEQFLWITLQIAEKSSPNAQVRLGSTDGKFFPKTPDLILTDFFRVVRPTFLDAYRRMAGPKVFMPGDYSRVSYFDPQPPP
jgi:hypothetical protein